MCPLHSAARPSILIFLQLTRRGMKCRARSVVMQPELFKVAPAAFPVLLTLSLKGTAQVAVWLLICQCLPDGRRHAQFEDRSSMKQLFSLHPPNPISPHRTRELLIQLILYRVHIQTGSGGPSPPVFARENCGFCQRSLADLKIDDR